MIYDCDVLILGGGCAGLSLAAALTETGSSLCVRILEPRREYKRDRTWCFWNTEPHPFEGCVTHHWNSWSISNGSQCVTRSSSQYAYDHIRADRFYQAAIARTESSDTQELCCGVTATTISAVPNGYKVESSSGVLSARFLFDSRPLDSSSATSDWTQRFIGWHVRTQAPVFNPSTVELMSFQPVTLAGRILFFYVLPFAPDEAMVEATCLDMPGLCASNLEAELHTWLETKTNGRAYEVLFREQGALPMATPTPSPRPVDGGYGIGIRGGRIKPSSGYAFLRIQRQSRLLAQALTMNRCLPQQFESAHYAQLDSVFLQALTQNPMSGPDYFLRLFERTPADVLVRFLSECGNPAESLRTALALPVLPFIKAALTTGGL